MHLNLIHILKDLMQSGPFR